MKFLFFSPENDDMESSKRCVKLLSLVFIISENSIRQISGFVLLLMLMLMSRVFSLAYAYVMLMLMLMLMR